MRIRGLLSVPLLSLTLAGLATRTVAAPPSSSTPYVDECGSCHVAYPAQLLSAAEWSRVLGDLERHYGADASLDAATRAAVARELGVARLAAPVTQAALPRITTKRWFREEHDEVGTATFRSPAVGSAANCSACHAGAERGNYDEDTVRMPRAWQ